MKYIHKDEKYVVDAVVPYLGDEPMPDWYADALEEEIIKEIGEIEYCGCFIYSEDEECFQMASTNDFVICDGKKIYSMKQQEFLELFTPLTI